MNRIFGKINMSWLKLILFAVIAGVYTGIVMIIPALENTSFRDIGIMYEWWVIFAVVIVTNCKKNYEAMLKCFVFFLISQPLVYIVEVLVSLPMEQAINYYTKIWLPMTFLTLPGGFAAFYCKKQNLLGSVILGLGNTIQTILGVFYTINTVISFPHHLISAIVCFGSVVLMSIAIQQKTKYRIISIVLPFLLTAAVVVFIKANGLWIVSNVF